MNCPKCNCDVIRTAMTRRYRSDAVIRRKKCTDCNHAWYTMETQIPTESILHSRNGEGASTFALQEDFKHLAYR